MTIYIIIDRKGHSLALGPELVRFLFYNLLILFDFVVMLVGNDLLLLCDDVPLGFVCNKVMP